MNWIEQAIYDWKHYVKYEQHSNRIILPPAFQVGKALEFHDGDPVRARKFLADQIMYDSNLASFSSDGYWNQALAAFDMKQTASIIVE